MFLAVVWVAATVGCETKTKPSSESVFEILLFFLPTMFNTEKIFVS